VSEHNAPDRPRWGGPVDRVEGYRPRVRRALVDELLDVLDAREDLIDLQVENGLDPLELRTSGDSGSAHGPGRVT
jgi:hypothetical protein